jgi:hypothetical protein
MNLFNKIKWILGILGVFLLVLATNRIDKNNFKRVEQSVDNIYNDRLLAKELLLEISLKFHKKELAYALNDSNYLENKNEKINAEISNLLESFNRIESTEKEELILKRLKRDHADLIELEERLTPNDILYSRDCKQIFTDINEQLSKLSAEQVQEGKQQKFLASKALENVELFSQIEIYILIVLGIILQLIILYSPKKTD